jgi:hypothetical protein
MLTQIHFNPDGSYNGKSSWISDDSVYKIIWDTSVNKWKLSGGTLGFSVYNSTPTYPPFTGWYILGGSGDVTVYEGVCNPSQPLDFTFSVNQPGCVCDGNITFNVNGDNPPYQYSIDGGITYSSSPIFLNLCSGIYSLKVMDSLLDVVSDTAILNPLQVTTIYEVKLTTTSNVLVNNSTTKTVQYVTTLSVNPPLPIGVIITFNFSHLNGFQRSPSVGSGVLTTNTILEKNGSPIIATTSNNTTTTSINLLPGCESNVEYNNILDEEWNNITIQSGDNYVINTVTTVQQHCVDSCCYAKSSDTYNVESVGISGCDCCNIQSKTLYE